MRRTTTTQHRPSRETEAKEKATLKRENKALKKQITRLRRQIEKVESIRQNAQEVLEDEEAVTFAETNADGSCPECGGHSVTTLELPTGILTACKDCKYRTMKK